jgi:PAS domain-containing protein
LVTGIRGRTENERFVNSALRRIFGPNRDEVTGRWRTFQQEELHDLYPLPDITRVVKCVKMRGGRRRTHFKDGDWF